MEPSQARRRPPARALPSFLLVLLVVVFFGAREIYGQSIHIAAQLNLNDRSDRWISTSYYGNIYSILSSTTLWWGPISDNNIGLSGIRVSTSPSNQRLTHLRKIPDDIGLQVAIILGFGFDPQTGHYNVQFTLYSNSPLINNLAFVAYDLNSKTWVDYAPLVPPVPPGINWEKLISNSVDLEARSLYFLISVDYILSAK